MRVRPFRDPADRPGVASLFGLAWHAAYDAIDGPAAIDRLLADQLFEPASGTEPGMFAMPAGDVALVAEELGQIVGSARAHPRADGVHLSGVYVLPQRLGTGIGSALLGALAARLPSATVWRVDVRPSSAGALSFYARHGFVVGGRTRTDVGAGHVVDVLELTAPKLVVARQFDGTGVP